MKQDGVRLKRNGHLVHNRQTGMPGSCRAPLIHKVIHRTESFRMPAVYGTRGLEKELGVPPGPTRSRTGMEPLRCYLPGGKQTSFSSDR